MVNLTALSKLITNNEARGFFLADKGEHYKLLAELSSKQNNIRISDIGTFRGCSALALSYNKTNTVISYDVADHKTISNIPDNVEFVLYNKPFSPDILNSSIIMLDIMHDGVQERMIIDFLIENNWKGTLIMDDIIHFPELKKLWNEIELPKQDVTSKGHWSGTGIITFE